MNASTIAQSLAFLIGRMLFDGVSPDTLAEKHGVSVDVVHQAGLDCREQLSRYFAEKEQFEYRLLNDDELQTRLIDSLRLLLDWHDAAVQAERLEDSQSSEGDD